MMRPRYLGQTLIRSYTIPSSPGQERLARPDVLLQSGRLCTFISLWTWICAFIVLFRYLSTRREGPPFHETDLIWQNPALFSLSNRALGKHLFLHNGVLGIELPHTTARMVAVFVVLHGTRVEFWNCVLNRYTTIILVLMHIGFNC